MIWQGIRDGVYLQMELVVADRAVPIEEEHALDATWPVDAQVGVSLAVVRNSHGRNDAMLEHIYYS